jgi:hypothetical protein
MNTNEPAETADTKPRDNLEDPDPGEEKPGRDTYPPGSSRRGPSSHHMIKRRFDHARGEEKESSWMLEAAQDCQG